MNDAGHDPEEAAWATASTLADALPFIQIYDRETVVIKYGGHAMGEESVAKQFAADAVLFPPLLFDLSTDPAQTHNLLVEGGQEATRLAWEVTQELLQWQMRTAERTLSGSFLHAKRGVVQARDAWW